MVDQPARRIEVIAAPPVPGEGSGEQVIVAELPPKERTPREMLAVLTRIVNRKVEALDALTHQGTLPLEPEWDDELDQAIERVCKLARADRDIEPTDEELLAQHDKGRAP